MARASDTSKLKRALQPMPREIRAALRRGGLLAAYQARPAYQRNDYLGWIARAKQQHTREKRLAQMLAELERGRVYMKMNWNPSPRTAPTAPARAAARGRRAKP